MAVFLRLPEQNNYQLIIINLPQGDPYTCSIYGLPSKLS